LSISFYLSSGSLFRSNQITALLIAMLKPTYLA